MLSAVDRDPSPQHEPGRAPEATGRTQRVSLRNRAIQVIMENNAYTPGCVSQADDCYLPVSNCIPNAEQLSQMSLMHFSNSGGKFVPGGTHAPVRTPLEVVTTSNCITGEDSTGVSLEVPFQMNQAMKPENLSSSPAQFYESVGALSNPASLRQGIVQANMMATGDMVGSSEHLALNTSLSLDACCYPENKHEITQNLAGAVSSVGIPVNRSYAEMSILQPSVMPRQGIKPQCDAPLRAKPDRMKGFGKGCNADSINKASLHNGMNSVSCCDSCECNEAIGLNAPGTELSLAIASVVDNGNHSTEESQSSHLIVSSFKNDPQSVSGNAIDKSVTRKGEMFIRLEQQVQELEVQLYERRTWAHQKALQAACKFSKDMLELKSLRLEHEEILCLKRDTQALEDNTMKRLTEMESALRKAGAQVDKANGSVRKLETENAELRAEMEAAKLSAAESNAKCQEVAKREKKSSKKIEAWEKQKAKILDEIAKQKQQTAAAQEQLASLKRQQHEFEVRWREEEKAKEEALSLADAEKWAREQLELAAKRREETWRQKADADFQRHKDDVERLESELEQLKIAATERCNIELSAAGGISLHTADTNGLQYLRETSSQLMQELAELQDARDVCRDRECVMCMSEESTVVFLPCAHQIVCVSCNDLHQKQGMQDCPSCRTTIQRRIQVITTSIM